jgi:phenylacetate-CoA ligase
MRRMARVSGRSDDMLIIRGVNVFPSQFEELLVPIAALAPHYQLEIDRRGHLDELTVSVECRPQFAGERDLHGQLQQQLEHSIKSLLGITSVVRVCEPGEVERSAGKARRVIDRR